jgi:hypothetical protein
MHDHLSAQLDAGSDGMEMQFGHQLKVLAHHFGSSGSDAYQDDAVLASDANYRPARRCIQLEPNAGLEAQMSASA